MLVFLTIVLMLACAYVFLVEGLFTSCIMCVNVILAGLITFNFWEPVADQLDPTLGGYEDTAVMVIFFSLTLGLLRLATNTMVYEDVEFYPLVRQIGGAIMGLIIGFLVAGFMACVLQTLPWHEHFMAFEWKYDPSEGPARTVLPPDRVWLAMMRHAGSYPLADEEDKDVRSVGSRYFKQDPDPYDRFVTFDKYSTFELRYARYRRYHDRGDPLKYMGEFDGEIHRLKAGPTGPPPPQGSAPLPNPAGGVPLPNPGGAAPVPGGGAPVPGGTRKGP